MTKLEELKITLDAACDVRDAAVAAIDAAYADRDYRDDDDIWNAAARKAVAALDAVADVARDAYEAELLAELKKIQEENGRMTKLEELKADYDAAEAAVEAIWAAADDDVRAAARDAARDAYEAELKKTQEENSMTKLEELKAAADAAWAVYDDAFDAWVSAVHTERGWDATTVRDYAASAAYETAREAYLTELEDTRVEL
jgi:hypothetical protein